MKIMEISKCEV